MGRHGHLVMGRRLSGAGPRARAIDGEWGGGICFGRDGDAITSRLRNKERSSETGISLAPPFKAGIVVGFEHHSIESRDDSLESREDRLE